MKNFDELNTLSEEMLSYEEYFGEMELSEEEKEKRIKLAEQFEILFLFFFMAYLEDKSRDYKKMIYEKYITVSLEFLGTKNVPVYIDDYAKRISEEIIRTTQENDESPYYTSKKRAVYISANEANVVGNYAQQTEAIKMGYKYKTWKTMKDRKVRHTHILVDEEKIGIFDTFLVGDSEMSFPKDLSLGASAEETANCRCVVKYSR